MTLERLLRSPYREALTGLRILLVEDELLVALETKSMMTDLGIKVMGPAPRVRAALAIVENEPLDGAVLDVNLRGDTSFSIADALADRNIPFLFVTGYGSGVIPPRFRGRVALTKPVAEEELAKAMAETFAVPAGRTCPA